MLAQRHLRPFEAATSWSPQQVLTLRHPASMQTQLHVCHTGSGRRSMPQLLRSHMHGLRPLTQQRALSPRLGHRCLQICDHLHLHTHTVAADLHSACSGLTLMAAVSCRSEGWRQPCGSLPALMPCSMSSCAAAHRFISSSSASLRRQAHRQSQTARQRHGNRSRSHPLPPEALEACVTAHPANAMGVGVLARILQ